MRTRELNTICDFVKAKGTDEAPASLTISHGNNGDPVFRLSTVDGDKTMDFAEFATTCRGSGRNG